MQHCRLMPKGEYTVVQSLFWSLRVIRYQLLVWQAVSNLLWSRLKLVVLMLLLLSLSIPHLC